MLLLWTLYLMMKTLVPLLSLLLLASCSGQPDPVTLSDIKNPTTADSLSCLYGQLYAENYLTQWSDDSHALSLEGREAYILGVKDGMKVWTGNQYRDQGIAAGIAIAIAMSDFEDIYGIRLDPEIFLGALTHDLESGDKPLSRARITEMISLIIKHHELRRKFNRPTRPDTLRQ